MSEKNVKALQITGASIGMGAGVALLAFPSYAADLLFEEKLESLVALGMARFSGAGLLALGIVCWLAHSEPRSSISRGLVFAMMFYYIAVAGVLAFASLDLTRHGSALWPTIILHAVMGAWCVATLFRNETGVLR